METEGATIAEVARIFGISENAVLQRIKRGTLPAKRNANRQWRIMVAATDQRPTNDQPTNQRTLPSKDAEIGHFPLRMQQESAALIIREAISPFIERLETVNQELGQVKAEREMYRARIAELESALASASPNAPYEAKPSPNEERPKNNSLPTHTGIQQSNQGFWDRLKGMFIGTGR